MTFKQLIEDREVVEKMLLPTETYEYCETYYDIEDMRRLIDLIEYIEEEKDVVVPILVVMETWDWFTTSRLECNSCYDSMMKRKEDYTHQLHHYLLGAKQALERGIRFNPHNFDNWLNSL